MSNTERAYLPGDILIPTEAIQLNKVILPKAKPILVLEAIASRRNGYVMHVRSTCSNAYNANQTSMCQYIVHSDIFKDNTDHIKTKVWDTYEDRLVMARNHKQLSEFSILCTILTIMIIAEFNCLGSLSVDFYLAGTILAIMTGIIGIFVQIDANKSLKLLTRMEKADSRTEETENLYVQYTKLAIRDTFVARKAKTIGICLFLLVLIVSLLITVIYFIKG